MTRQSAGAIWKRARSLVALSCLAILAACGGGDDAPPPPATETELSFLDSANFEKVLHVVPADAAASVRTSAASATTLTIHYKRKSADYTDWALHTWGDGSSAPTEWTKPLAASGKDNFGVIFTPPVAASGTFNYIFHKGDVKDGGDQTYTLVPGANEIWRIEGDTATYNKNPDTAGPLDLTTIRVHYKRFDSNFSVWGLHLWEKKDSGELTGLDVASLQAGVAIGNWSSPVAFGKMANYAAVSAGEVVFDIPVINPTTDSKQKSLTFLIHGTSANPNGGNGNKDGRTNDIVVNYANLTVKSKIAEIWLVQEDSTVYSAVPDTRSVATKDARAYWLSKSLIQWPRVDGTGVFKLYYSKTAQIVATKDAAVKGSDGSITLSAGGSVPSELATRFKFVGAGVVLSVGSADVSNLPSLLTNQLVLVQEDASGKVQNATTAQLPGVLDDLYSAAKDVTDLGVKIAGGNTTFKVWAPTALQVKLGLYDTATSKGVSIEAMSFDSATGIWSITKSGDLTGKYYVFVPDVFVLGSGVIRNRVTDPYSISLNTDSKRSYIADLAADALKPAGWDKSVAPDLADPVDMSIYELHVRDFSINDSTVSAANRGKYLAFTEADSNGMKHLKALHDNGLTDVHLLPVFDLATVPESGCTTPAITAGASDSTAPSDALNKVVGQDSNKNDVHAKDVDCFNWGYDPLHYTAPEGSYASDASDGAKRIVEFRQMVAALHAAGIRVGMDVVYNHTSAAGRVEKAILDRIVPGYYHRLSSDGKTVLNDTCCSDTAAENLMMGKLVKDSVTTWATQYKIDSFRFDLMGFLPRTVITETKTSVDKATGRNIFLLGEGWNYGAVGGGARFVQASQLSMNDSGIGTFSDRARDAVRGGNYQQSRDQGYATGYFYDQNDVASGQSAQKLMDIADTIRVGLAGSLRSYSFKGRDDLVKTGADFKYGDDPAGYVAAPQEVVNYYENHDNATMWDAIVAKMPKATTVDDRLRAQTLAAAINSFSQGIAYFHAGSDVLRSKSMDANSYDSGDWFNRLDWTYNSNNFGVGLPLQGDQNIAKLFLAASATSANYLPSKSHITAARDMFNDLLAIRKSSQLFRLRKADDVKSCLTFFNTGSAQEPTVLVGHLNGTVCSSGANFKQVMYFVNVDKVAHDLTIDAQKGMSYSLHPVQASGSDARAKTAAYDNTTGKFSIPARTAVVFVTQTDAPAAGAPAPVAAGSLRVHFQKSGAAYSDWGVAAWSGATVDSSAGWPANRVRFNSTDAWGGYTDIVINSAKTQLDFKIIDGSAAEACGSNQAIVFVSDIGTKGQEAWVTGCSVTATKP